MVGWRNPEGTEMARPAKSPGRAGPTPDQQAIQGLWRLVSCVARGDRIGTPTTHVQFDGNRMKEIDPSRVDGGEWSTFQLDPQARPKRITMTTERAGKGGKPVRRVDRWLYEIEGDTLRLCWPRVLGD